MANQIHQSSGRGPLNPGLVPIFVMAMLFSNTVGAESHPALEELSQVEVSATFTTAQDKVTAQMSDTRAGPYCFFTLTGANGVPSANENYRKEGYAVGGNPSVTRDRAGTLYRLCMSVQADYSAGSLDLSRSTNGVRWTPWQNITTLHGRIPDKPKLFIEKDGALLLAYSEIAVHANEIRSTLKLLRSTDHAKTWREIPLNAEARGGQGSYLNRGERGTVLASWGTYANGPIFFAHLEKGAVATRMISANSAALVPSTEIHADRGRVVVLVSETHASNLPVQAILSDDTGKTWRAPITVAPAATLASGEFDRFGNFHVVWTEAQTCDQGNEGTGSMRYACYRDITVKHRSLNPHGEWGPVDDLLPPTSPATKIYLGANQSVTKDRAGKLHAFVIDWSTGQGKIRDILLTP